MGRVVVRLGEICMSEHRHSRRTELPTRRTILGVGLTSCLAAACRSSSSTPTETQAMNQQPSPTSRMPVLFLGHGSPMNAIEPSTWTRAWTELSNRIPEPRAIVSISAHWYTQGTFVLATAQPETIHDFSGFPPALYEVQYPARGDASLASRIREMLASVRAEERVDWGLDHGTWSVLRSLRPKADVPVLQVSIDRTADPSVHVAIGRALAPLRDDGVLILGSGNITHNLRHAMMSRGGELPDWAKSFDADTVKALSDRDPAFLARAHTTDLGRTAHPSPDHYLPLLYAYGASTEQDKLSFPVEGFDLGSISMRAVRFG